MTRLYLLVFCIVLLRILLLTTTTTVVVPLSLLQRLLATQATATTPILLRFQTDRARSHAYTKDHHTERCGNSTWLVAHPAAAECAATMNYQTEGDSDTATAATTNARGQTVAVNRLRDYSRMVRRMEALSAAAHDNGE